jgi:hypothetical protein
VSGKQRKTGSDRLQERAQALIERGLTSYRRGEVEAAVIDWRHALALDPHAERAREYIEHALAHKDFDGDTTEEPGERTEPKPPLPDTKPHATSDTQPDAGRDSSPDVGPAAAGTPALDRSLGLAPTSPALPRVLHKTFEGPPMPAERLAAHFAGQSDGAATEKMGPADVDGPVQPLEPTDTQPVATRGAEMADTLLPIPLPEGLADAVSGALSAALIEEMPPEDTEPLNRPPPGLVQDEPPVSLAPTVEIPRAEMDRIAPAVPEKANIRTLARTQLDALETYEIHLAPPDTAARLDRSKRAALPPVVIEDVEEDETPEPRSAAAHDQARSRTQTAELYGGARKMPSRPPSGLADAVSKLSVSAPSAGAAPGRPRPPEVPPVPGMDPDEPELPEVAVEPIRPDEPDPAGAQAAQDTADEDVGPADPVARMLLERLDDEKPLRRGDDASYRGRVLWLIEYAQSEYIGGDYQTAVIALDLALDQAPDSDAVRSLIEERTHSLIEIYASYEGDPSAVPSLAMSPSEYGQRALDSHAAFLLSRVDGMLTIDDLMTVSGMPTLEAHRHLCNLLRQGILTLR